MYESTYYGTQTPQPSDYDLSSPSIGKPHGSDEIFHLYVLVPFDQIWHVADLGFSRG